MFAHLRVTTASALPLAVISLPASAYTDLRQDFLGTPTNLNRIYFNDTQNPGRVQLYDFRSSFIGRSGGTSGIFANEICIQPDVNCTIGSGDMKVVLSPCTASSAPTESCIRSLEYTDTGNSFRALTLDHEVVSEPLVASNKYRTLAVW
jgi:hypothetical protein